jgi:hypothetical protein
MSECAKGGPRGPATIGIPVADKRRADHRHRICDACELVLIRLIMLIEAFFAYLTLAAAWDVVRGVFLGGAVPALLWGAVLTVWFERRRRVLTANRRAAHGR